MKVLFATTNEAKVGKYRKDNFYFVDKPCEKRNPGYPLDSISVIPEFNQYFLELTEENKKRYQEKDNIDNVIEFIISNIYKYNKNSE